MMHSHRPQLTAQHRCEMSLPLALRTSGEPVTVMSLPLVEYALPTAVAADRDGGC